MNINSFSIVCCVTPLKLIFQSLHNICNSLLKRFVVNIISRSKLLLILSLYILGMQFNAIHASGEALENLSKYIANQQEGRLGSLILWFNLSRIKKVRLRPNGEITSLQDHY